MNTLERRIMTTPLRPVRLKKRKAKRRPQRRDRGATDKDNTGQGAGADDGQGDDEPQTNDDGQGDDEPQTNDDSPGTITGYASVFYSESEPGTEYELWSDPSFRAVERVAAGCFRQALGRPDDVRGLFNHEPDALLGRSGSGTLRLEEDQQGLRYEIDLPDTQVGRDVAELVDRGDLTGSSFGFIVEQESWRELTGDDGQRLAIRTVESVRLMDVGPVTYPAYSATSAGRSIAGSRALGSVQEARDSYSKWRRCQDEQAVPLAARLAAVRVRALEAAQQAG